MKVAFYEDLMDTRGTSIAIYDYARYNEELLGNTSIIITTADVLSKCNSKMRERYRRRFRIYSFLDEESLDNLLEDENCDVLYCIRYGVKGIVSTKIKTVIHCVFELPEKSEHIYAAVSSTLAKKFGQSVYVPHMIGLRPSQTGENLRSKLNIPESAIVFGRYGGMDTFNIQFCVDAIVRLIQERSDIYFLLISTVKFISHPQVIYLDPIVEDDDKNRFICTCDAHIECGTLGHSFGLAIGEFSVNKKPIIAYCVPKMWNTAHFEILQEKGKYFSNYLEFYKILNDFKKEVGENCYTDFSPEKVMPIFKKVFLDSISI